MTPLAFVAGLALGITTGVVIALSLHGSEGGEP